MQSNITPSNNPFNFVGLASALMLTLTVGPTCAVVAQAADVPVTTIQADYANRIRDFTIQSGIDSITLRLKGGAGGEAKLKDGVGCTKLHKRGGGGATVTVTYPIGSGFSASHLAIGGTLRFIAGGGGLGASDICWGHAEGSGGASSGVAYLPPGQDAGGDHWYTLAVAGGGGGGELSKSKKRGRAGSDNSSSSLFYPGDVIPTHGQGGKGYLSGGGIISSAKKIGDSTRTYGLKFYDSVAETANKDHGFDKSYTYVRGKPLANPGLGGRDAGKFSEAGGHGFTGGGSSASSEPGSGGGFSGGDSSLYVGSEGGRGSGGAGGGSWYSTHFGAKHAVVKIGGSGNGEHGYITVVALGSSVSDPWNLGADVRYLKISDANLYLHAEGGAVAAARETLHACPKGSNYPNCQWVFVPSTTNTGAYYIKSKDVDLYLHAEGGSKSGASVTLHACPKAKDHANCQWYLEKTASSHFYIRSGNTPLYLHAEGGSRAAAPMTLNACPKASNHANCKWQIEGAL